MKKLLVMILALMVVFTATVPATADEPAPPKVKIPIVAVDAQDQAGLDKLNAAGLDIIGMEDDYVVLIMVKDFEKQYFEANNIEYVVVEEDATAQVDWLGYKKENSGGFSLFASPITGIPGTSASGNPTLEIDTTAVFNPTDVAFDEKYGFPQRLGYRTVTEYYGEMNYLAQQYPDLVKVNVIGNTVNGVPIYALEICNAPGVKDGRPETYHMAGNHAREWPTNELVMNLSWYLVTQYGINAEVTALLNSTRIWLLPVSNPDGTHYDQRNNPGTWRKNRVPNPDGSYGVDLNRNWSYRWGSNTGSSSSYNSDTYRGVAPNSEPESQAMTGVYKNNQIISSLSSHTSGQLVIFAWAYVHNPDNAHPLLAELARKQADINMHADQNGNVMYAQSGEINDYLWGAVRALGFTYEYGTSFVPAYGGYDRYKAIAPYNDYYGKQRRIPLTYPTQAAASKAGAPATNLTAPVVFMTEPFIIGYGSTDRFATVEKVQALGDLTGKILMTHQASSNNNNTAVAKAAQDAGAVAVIFCGNTATGADGGGYGHYTPNLGGNDASLITIPVAGTSKPYLREFNEHVLKGGTNTLTLTSYAENTDSLYSQFERSIGGYMLNMSFAKTYASHIKGQILDVNNQPIPNAALDLEIEIESILLNTDGSERPAGSFKETQTAHYDVAGGTYDWNVLPSKQPEFTDRGYDITASANGKYDTTQNVKIGFYQETVNGVNFVLPNAISSTFDFSRKYAPGTAVTVPFTTYVPAGTGSTPGIAGDVTVTVGGVRIPATSLGGGNYTVSYTPVAGKDADIIINFNGQDHSAFSNTIQVAEAAVNRAVVRIAAPTTVPKGGDLAVMLNVGNAPSLAQIAVTFEVDGAYLTGSKFEALNGMQLMGDVSLTPLPGGKLEGKALLWSNRDISATAATDFFRMTFKAGDQLGSTSFKVTDISLVSLNYSANNPPNPQFVAYEFYNGTSSINVTVQQSYSKYDVNHDGAIDLLDLAAAQYYFMVREGDIRWSSSSHYGYLTDVNGDKVVNILDLMEIKANIA